MALKQIPDSISNCHDPSDSTLNEQQYRSQNHPIYPNNDQSKLVKVSMHSLPSQQQMSPSGVQMIETMVDLRSSSRSIPNRPKRLLQEEGGIDLKNTPKNNGSAVQRRGMTSERQGRTSNSKRYANETLMNENKRYRAMPTKKEEMEEQGKKEDGQETSSNFQTKLHQHALAAAAAAQQLPIHGGKHSTTFEMIESRGDENQPDKIVRVHVISDRFSACIPCRRRKIRCMPSDEMPRPKSGTCGTCLRRNKTCVWTDDSNSNANSTSNNSKANNNTGKQNRKKEGKEVVEMKMSKETATKITRKRLTTIKCEEDGYEMPSPSSSSINTTNENSEMKTTKSIYLPDNSNLMDPPKFENINWAGMQYPPFYVPASQMNPSSFVQSSTTPYSGTVDKNVYPSNSSEFVTPWQSPLTHTHPIMTHFNVSQPLLTSRSEGGYDLSFAAQQQQYYQHHHHHQSQPSHPQIYHIQPYHGSPSSQHGFSRAISLPTVHTGTLTTLENFNNTEAFNSSTSHSHGNKMTVLSPSMSEDSPGSLPSTHFNTPIQTPNDIDLNHPHQIHHHHHHHQNKIAPNSQPPSLMRAHSFHYLSGSHHQQDHGNGNEGVQSGILSQEVRTMSIDCSTFNGQIEVMNTAAATTNSNSVLNTVSDNANIENHHDLDIGYYRKRNEHFKPSQERGFDRQVGNGEYEEQQQQQQNSYHNLHSQSVRIRGSSFSSNSMGEYISTSSNEQQIVDHSARQNVEQLQQQHMEIGELSKMSAAIEYGTKNDNNDSSTNNNTALDWSNSDLLPCSASNY